MKKNIFLLMTAFLLTNCAGEQKKEDISDIRQIDFDYNVCINKLDAGEFDLGAYSDSIMQIIPLETTDEALIAEIDEIEIRNDRIYIMDQLARSVYVFDMTGKYLNRINKVGQGPGEYGFLSYMAVTDSTVIVFDHFMDKLIEYKIPTMQFLREERVSSSLISDMFYLPAAKSVCFMNDYCCTDAGKYLLFVRKEDTKEIDKQLPFDKEPFCLGMSGYHYAVTSDHASVIYDGNDTIYRIDDKGKARPEYFVNIKNDRVVYGEKVETVHRDNPPGRVFGISSINESDKYLFLNISVRFEGVIQKGHYSDYMCLYNKQSRETVIYPEYAQNSKFDNNESVLIRRIIDNKIIEWTDADIMFMGKEYAFTKRKFTNKTFEQQYKQVLSNLKEDDNPVVFIYNLK
ncbi:MAG: 6-bladed beta-propeller [Tannerella sp.]|jgi:hypothetical protein|nr:6-bladed beta-propeller [Tannerella sp.]